MHNSINIFPIELRAEMISQPDRFLEIQEVICKFLYKNRKSTINVNKFTFYIINQFEGTPIQKFLKNFPLAKIFLKQHISRVFNNASDFEIIDIYKDSNSFYHISFKPIYKPLYENPFVNKFVNKFLPF